MNMTDNGLFLLKIAKVTIDSL